MSFYYLFVTYAAKYGLSVSLLMGVCSVESSLDPTVINYNDGGEGNHSYGLCQLQYSTARELGYPKDRFCVRGPITKCGLLRPERNIEYAAQYLASQMNKYRGDERKAVSAYNAGIASTHNSAYVRKVLQRRRMFK